MFKNILASTLTFSMLLTLSTQAIADTRVSNGSGGEYSYELWRKDKNAGYYLKIWMRKDYPSEYPRNVSYSFESSREALEHFDCNYAKKSIPACPNN
jgi:hypothetical protein